MFLVDVLRDVPGRIASLAADGESTDRRLPIETSEANGKRIHHRRRHSARVFLLFAGLELGRRHLAFSFGMNRADRRRKIIVQPHLGDVHHDADAGRIGQDVLVGQNDHAPGRRRPPIDAGVGVGDFLRRHAEPSPDVEQRVALLNLVRDQIADDIVLAVRKRIGVERTFLEFVLGPRAVSRGNRDQRDEKQGREVSNRKIDESSHFFFLF